MCCIGLDSIILLFYILGFRVPNEIVVYIWFERLMKIDVTSCAEVMMDW